MHHILTPLRQAVLGQELARLQHTILLAGSHGQPGADDRTSGNVQSSERIYRRLLTCLPADFRAEAADSSWTPQARARATERTRAGGRPDVLGPDARQSGRGRAGAGGQRPRHEHVVIRPGDLMAFFTDFRIAARVLEIRPAPRSPPCSRSRSAWARDRRKICTVVHAVLLQPLQVSRARAPRAGLAGAAARQVPEFRSRPVTCRILREQGTLFEGFAGIQGPDGRRWCRTRSSPSKCARRS